MNEGMPQGEMGEASNNSGQTGAGDAKAEVKGLVNQLESLLDEYMVKKAPFALPIGLKEFIVKVSPYLVIIFAILTLPIIFAAIGLSAFLAPFAMMGAAWGGYGWGFGLGAIISLVAAVITLIVEAMAVPGLFKRTRGGWRLVFYATIISLIGSILSFNIVGGIIGAIISWYILFQVKDMYTN
jgi:MFS family permease